MRPHGLFAALGRWFGASAIGVGMVALLAMVPEGSVWLVAFTALLLIGGPLALARRSPRAGTWLAMALLSASPFAMVMMLGVVDRPLIVSRWRCGTAMMGLWLVAMPVAQAGLALLTGPLWRLRRRLARAWRPATAGALVLAAGLLLPGLYRAMDRGSVDADVLVRRGPSLELPPGRPQTAATVAVGDLAIRRECGPDRCTIGLTRAHAPETELTELTELDVGTTLSVYPRGRWLIVEGEPSGTSAPGDRHAFDIEHGQPTDVAVRDVAEWFGPSWGSLALLLLAVLFVIGSLRAPPRGPMVWRRLGARRILDYDETEDAIAWRSMHLAVLVAASLPLLASAVVGLVL